MVKKRISDRRRKSLEKSRNSGLSKIEGLSRFSPIDDLVDPKSTALAILECLQNNDPEGVMEMISIYLNALNKTRLRKRTNLPKSTLYSSLKHRNPTIKTLAKIMYTSTH